MVTYEYTSLTNVQNELRATTAFSSSTSPTNTAVSRWIEEASDTINHLAGDVFGVTSYDEYIDYNSEDTILVKHSPIISVSSITYATVDVGLSGRSSSWVTKTEDTDYLVYTDRGTIDIIWANWQPSDGKKRIRVQYTGGYAEVPPRIQELCTKMVALRALDTLMASNVNSGNSGGSVSVGSISIVEPADFGIGSYKKLRDDIEMLKKEVVSGFGIHRY